MIIQKFLYPELKYIIVLHAIFGRGIYIVMRNVVGEKALLYPKIQIIIMG